MTVSGGFTQTIDWLAFTLPKAEVADVITLVTGSRVRPAFAAIPWLSL